MHYEALEENYLYLQNCPLCTKDEKDCLCTKEELVKLLGSTEKKQEVKLAVVGSRGFNDKALLEKELDILCKEFNIIEIISGAARGCDTLAANYAKEKGIKLTELKPDWNKHGKAAGFIRNTDIWNLASENTKEGIVSGIAFWDGKSKGTAHSFSIAKKQNKIIKIINY